MKKPLPFGKYLLLERVNVGGMAEVFLAKAFGVEGFERLLAIKRILPTMVEDEEFITMFLDEARISVQLNHANVVQIHELGKHDESFYIAMEYCSGRDLRHLLERFRKKKEVMPTPMAVFIASKMCEGLDYAHRKKDARGMDLNIVHRDVSPQNILISYEGEVKIIDFGIAKAANRAQKTQAGILKGKFGYMSPEQVRGLPIDRRSDVFAVGVILYEMLTGERLFVGESDFSTLEKVRNADVLPPRQYNSNIPVGLEKVVLKALARDVEDRYQWGSDMQEDLMRFLLSGDQIFSNKQLSTFVKEAFAEDLARERERLERYADVEKPDQMEVSGVTAKPEPKPKSRSDVPVVKQTITGKKPTNQVAAAGVEVAGDPNNPVIPPPEPGEVEGTGERTQIFQPAFTGRETAPEEPTGEAEAPAGVQDGDDASAPTMMQMESPFAKGQPKRPSSANVPRVPPKLEPAQPEDDPEAANATMLGMESPLAKEPPKKNGKSRPTAAELPAEEPHDDAGEPEDANATMIGLPAPKLDARRPPARDSKPGLKRPPPRNQLADQDEHDERTDGGQGEPDELGATMPPSSKHAVAPGGGKNKLPLIAGGAVALVAIVGVAAFALKGGPKTGGLVVIAEPESAEIAVDGNPAANAKGVTVPVGEHEVVVTAEGFKPMKRKVTIVAGEDPQKVVLTLQAEEKPEPKPDAPKPEEKKPDEAKPDDKVAVKPDEKPAEKPAPKPDEKPAPAKAALVALTVESFPAGAEIEFGGKKHGKAPKTFKDVDPAKVREVKLTLKGYGPKTEPLVWNGSDAKVNLVGTLEKLPEPAVVEKPKPPPEKPKTTADPKPAKAVVKGLGKLVTSSKPVAKVSVDGKDTGRWTPIPPGNPLELGAGDHTVTYVAADGRKATRKVSVPVNDIVKLIGVDDFQ